MLDRGRSVLSYVYDKCSKTKNKVSSMRLWAIRLRVFSSFLPRCNIRKFNYFFLLLLPRCRFDNMAERFQESIDVNPKLPFDGRKKTEVKMKNSRHNPVLFQNQYKTIPVPNK